MATYTRSNDAPTIVSRVDLDLILLSPTDIQDKLKGFIEDLNYTADNRVICEPQSVMYGFCAPPDGPYYVEQNTPRIAVWYSAKDAKTVTTATWYDAAGNQDIVSLNGCEGDSILFLSVPDNASRLVLNGKITYVNPSDYCSRVQNNPVLVYFFDQYGLPQSISLSRTSYSTKYETLGNYRSYNNGLKYEYHKQANYNIVVGEDGINKEFIPFVNGFVLSEAYMAEFDEYIESTQGQKNLVRNLVTASVTELSSAIAKKEETLSVTATIEIHPTDALKLENVFLNGML